MLTTEELREQIQQKVIELLQYGEVTRKSSRTIKTAVTKSCTGRIMKTVVTDQTVSGTETRPTPLPVVLYLLKILELEEAIALVEKHGFEVIIKDGEIMKQWINAQNQDNPLEAINQGFSDETIEQIKAQVLELDQ